MRHSVYAFAALIAAASFFGVSAASAQPRGHEAGMHDRSAATLLATQANAAVERSMLQRMRADARRASRAANLEAREQSSYHIAVALIRADTRDIARETAAHAVDFSRHRLPRTRALTARNLQAGRPQTCDGRPATIVGTDGNDTIKGTPGRDVIVGLGGDDQIYGYGQDDVICGGAGDDVIWGGAGNDRLFGGDGHDLIDAGPGNDTSDGGPGDRDGATFWDASAPISASLVTGTATGEGSDTFTNMEELHGGPYDDTLTGDAGNNTLFGLDGSDTLAGGDGNDTLSGGQGNDALDGGTGQDTVWFYAATGPIHASLATGTSTGQGNDTLTNFESLSGGDYGDTLVGDSGDNVIWGNGGDDTLNGGAGNDLIDAGPGNDTSDGGPGDDAATFWDSPAAVTASLVTGTASGEGSDTFTNMEGLHGSDYDDTFTGDAGNNTLFGLNGNDALAGGDGNDFINGGAGNDTISAGDGNDFLDGGAGNDAMDGGAGQYDTVVYFNAPGPVTASLATGTASGDGNDNFTNVEQLQGGPYDDTLAGGLDEDSLGGNGGNDTLVGGPGTDFLYGNDANDTLGGNAGNDFLLGGPGDDAMDGGAGFDAVAYWNAPGPVTASLATGTATGEGADTFTNAEQLIGSPYADTLYGGSGDGWLIGNGGDDTIVGGDGNEFLFGNDGNDTISGGAGDDFLAPGSGIDTLDGGPGFDKAAYWDAPGPITASLANGTGTGDGEDTFTNLEGIHGGNFGDTLYGDAADNELVGNDGNDTLYGGGGNDFLNGGNGDDALYGEAGNDYLDGSDGIDFLDGGPDWDACLNGETVVNCEG